MTAKHSNDEQPADLDCIQSLASQLPAAIWTTDRQLRFTKSFGGVLARLNLQPNQVVGITLHEFFQTDDDHFPAIAAHHRALEGSSASFEQNWAGMFFDSRVEPLRDASGEIIGCVGMAQDVTDRKLAESSVGEHEQQLRDEFSELDLLYSTAPVGLCLMDTDLRFVRINEMLAAINGHSVSAHLGEHLRDVIPEIAPIVEPHLRRVIATGQPVLDLEVTGRTPANLGQELTALANYYPLKNSRGEVVGLSVVVQEITARKQNEEALREAHERLERVMNSVSDYLWSGQLSATGEFGYLYYSPVVERITGRPPEFFMAGPDRWLSMVHPDDREAIQVTMRRFLESRTEYEEAEYRIVHANQQVRWVRDSARATRLDDGSIRIDGVVSDITDRKEAELALVRANNELELRVEDRASKLTAANSRLEEEIEQRQKAGDALTREKEYNSHIVQNAPTIIVVLSPDGTTISVNDAIRKVAGYQPDELIGANWWETFYPGEDYEQVEQLYRDITDGPVANYDMVLTTKYGVKRTVSWNSVNRFDAKGRLTEIIGIGSDVTVRNLMQEDLVRKTGMLERLLNMQESDRRLVSCELHDGVAQQISTASMYLETMEGVCHQDPARAEEKLQNALNLVAQANREVRRVMTGLRLPLLDDLGVVAAIEHLVREAKQVIPNISFDHHTSFSRLAAPLENSIFRVVQEAINNACRHSGARTARVELLQLAHHLRVKVRDWGCGFDPKQVDPDRFGLHGIRERVRLLGSVATIDSAPEKGTIVVVDFPIVLPYADEPSEV